MIRGIQNSVQLKHENLFIVLNNMETESELGIISNSYYPITISSLEVWKLLYPSLEPLDLHHWSSQVLT